MLAQHLEELRPKSGLESRLLAVLRSALVNGNIEIQPCVSHYRGEHHVEAVVSTVSSLRRAVYDFIEAHGIVPSVRESRLVAEWFVAMTETARGEQSRQLRAELEARKRAEGRLALFAQVSALAESMEYEAIVPAIARLVTESVVDWCVIDTVENGQLRRAAIAHRDPAALPAIEALLASPSLIGETPEEVLAGHVQIFNPGLPHARWMALVPFVVLGSTVAVARLVRADESERPDELQLIDELTRRVVQILENARLHQELRRSERRFRVALEHARVAVFEEDAEQRIRFIYNPELGTVADEMVGIRLADAVPPEQAARLAALKAELVATGKSFRVEVQPKPDVFLIVHYEPLRDATGAVTGFVGAAVNVTDERDVQQELAESLAFREQMMGVLGHDLRNPLGAVRGLSQLLGRNPELPQKTTDGLLRIDQAARRMSELIETLLDFTHSRFHGSLPVERKPADLAEVTRAVVDELRSAHPAREIRLSAPERLPGDWDPARMAQVVSNLVVNALTHGAPDAPVEISLGRGDGVVLRVANRGRPIPEELRAKMFEPFRRGDGHNGNGNGKPRGLGLGLFIAREIVTAHGGSIGVESSGDLTVFRVRLG